MFPFDDAIMTNIAQFENKELHYMIQSTESQPTCEVLLNDSYVRL